jgi:hypothetical protein
MSNGNRQPKARLPMEQVMKLRQGGRHTDKKKARSKSLARRKINREDY